MAAQPVSVNLLDQPEFNSSSIARIMNWAITYGRYIMIGTEVIVLVAFISRFSLDRQLTDLREEIAQKQIILEANQDFENEFLYVQDTLKKVSALTKTQDKPITILQNIISIIPDDVFIQSYDYSDTSLEIRFTAGTTQSFSSVLTRLQNIESLHNIEVSEISKDTLRGTEFLITADIK